MLDLVHFKYGEVLLTAGEGERAAKEFLAATKVERAEPELVTMAHLYAARAYDLAGKRDAALSEYREVLTRPDIYAAHEEAKKGLKQPYKTEVVLSVPPAITGVGEKPIGRPASARAGLQSLTKSNGVLNEEQQFQRCQARADQRVGSARTSGASRTRAPHACMGKFRPPVAPRARVYVPGWCGLCVKQAESADAAPRKPLHISQLVWRQFGWNSRAIPR